MDKHDYNGCRLDGIHQRHVVGTMKYKSKVAMAICIVMGLLGILIAQAWFHTRHLDLLSIEMMRANLEIVAGIATKVGGLALIALLYALVYIDKEKTL